MVKAAIVRILTSAKTWTAVIGLIATAGAAAFARWGIQLSDAAIAQVAITVSGIFGILLHAQGQADRGKEAAKVVASSSAVPTTQIAGGDIVNPPAAPVQPAAVAVSGEVGS